jgi:hypothetical protein
MIDLNELGWSELRPRIPINEGAGHLQGSNEEIAWVLGSDIHTSGDRVAEIIGAGISERGPGTDAILHGYVIGDSQLLKATVGIMYVGHSPEERKDETKRLKETQQRELKQDIAQPTAEDAAEFMEFARQIAEAYED